MMGLRFGWRATEVRESIWREDEALGEIPAAAMASWREDGDASWLRPFCTKGQPQIINFRNLTPDETRVMQSYWVDPNNALEGYARCLLMAFRIGVDFPGKELQKTAEGTAFSIIVKERGLRMLAEPFVAQIGRDYPAMISFYGKLIYDASVATETEKKASSPLSTPTPSSAAESTAATTETSPTAAVA
jgi:hypothetical protein